LSYGQVSMQTTIQSGQILIVEDDEDTRSLLEFLLRQAGYDVVAAMDGEQALIHIETMAPPQLILLDIMMPYLDGFDILARIKSRPGWQTIPVLMLTARDSEEDIQKGLDLGIAAYIPKPFKTHALIAEINRLTRPELR
jgi:DNA-binding response OmpR family regulator